MQDEELAVPFRGCRLGILGTCIGRYLFGVANSPCSVRGWVLDVLVCGVPIYWGYLRTLTDLPCGIRGEELGIGVYRVLD